MPKMFIFATKNIYEACGEADRAAYGRHILNYISENLTKGFRSGFGPLISPLHFL